MDSTDEKSERAYAKKKKNSKRKSFCVYYMRMLDIVHMFCPLHRVMTDKISLFVPKAALYEALSPFHKYPSPLLSSPLLSSPLLSSPLEPNRWRLSCRLCLFFRLCGNYLAILSLHICLAERGRSLKDRSGWIMCDPFDWSLIQSTSSAVDETG